MVDSMNSMAVVLCLPLLAVLLQPALGLYNCSSEYNRTPENLDLSVDCGTSTITLEVNLCTAQWAGFNYSELALNGKHNNSQCQGFVDTSENPPIIRFQLPVNNSQGNPCRHSLQIVDEAPDRTGPFSHFSTIQSVIITGFIDTPTSSQGMISYSTDLYYHFSCRYPLEYLLNNTQIAASSVSVATSDNNGTFINSLKMGVYNGSDYSYPLIVPEAGLELRTSIYVEVKAINLTGNFYVLLDYCFATPTSYNMSQDEKHTFFTGCSVNPKTTVVMNGQSTAAQFYFETFRFVQHRDQEKSSIYLHCILRLCESSKCEQLLAPCSSRRKRSLVPYGKENADSASLSLGPIFVSEKDGQSAAGSNEPTSRTERDVTGLVVGVVFGSAGAVLLVLGGWFVLKKYFWMGGSSRLLN
ncbi:zona pellucida-like domain-containing protein 1 [Gouania willdenowi]|uniref:zona pellucida-like domain-containing protein 1 n=1 Tax=Gouania willdenowi TaxID=441366 RepID=UPI00105597F4|nr:zona pellucida-like domain-containing protein 1 [Gouania willdenowi]